MSQSASETRANIAILPNKYSQQELPKMIAPPHLETMPQVAHHVRRMMETTSPIGAAERSCRYQAFTLTTPRF